MKLYATIESERASKGQGGNKHLTIKLQKERLKFDYIIEYTENSLIISKQTEDGGVVVWTDEEIRKAKQ